MEDPSGRAGGRAVITDGPGNGVYGYGACLDASYDQFKFGWPSTTLFADQYVLLAKSEFMVPVLFCSCYIKFDQEG